jgi:hypothetical protein
MKYLSHDKFVEKLKSDFPNLYRSKCSITIDKGWYELIYNLSEKLEKIILTMPEDERQNYYAVQVKEKFRSLRFYVNGFANEQFHNCISEAEELSYSTCEICGSLEGKSCAPTGYWIRTLCDKCQTIKEIID